MDTWTQEVQNLGGDCQAPSQKREGKRRLPGALGLVCEDLHHPDALERSETSQALTENKAHPKDCWASSRWQQASKPRLCSAPARPSVRSCASQEESTVAMSRRSGRPRLCWPCCWSSPRQSWDFRDCAGVDRRRCKLDKAPVSGTMSNPRVSSVNHMFGQRTS